MEFSVLCWFSVGHLIAGVMFQGNHMIRSLLKALYVMILAGLVWDALSFVTRSYQVEMAIKSPMIIVSVLTLTFFFGYLAYLYCKKVIVLSIAFVSYVLYSSWSVGKTYKWPLVNENEYLFALILYLILGLPMIITLVRAIRVSKDL